MANKSSSERGLNYNAKLNIDEARKNAQLLKKELLDLGVGVSKGFDVKPMTAFQQGSMKLKQELQEKAKVWKDLQITEQAAKTLSAQHKATVDELKIAEQELNKQLKENKITADEYALSQRKIVDAQKLAVAAQKEADRQAGEANKRLKEQLSLARQEEAQRERNRKKLEQESSAYYQLNKALNNVRKEAKDVLAGMYLLEQQGKKNTDEYKALADKSGNLVKQTQILDKGLKQIDATLGLHQRNVGNYGEAVESLSPHFATINGHLSVFGTSITQLAAAGGLAEFGASIIEVGKTIFEFLISPVGIIITALTTLFALFQANKGTVIDFDDKLLDVGKTTGLASRGLVDLGNSVIELSKKLETVSSEKLLEFATVAGSLGVTGTKDILAFSEALAKLEIASDIQGEEGANSIASLLTLTDGGVENVQAFGDEIVNLGNAFAATEKAILANAERIAQNTGVYKFARQEVLAYATATKSVGLEAEVVGSTLLRTLDSFEEIIRTGKGISELTKATGLSVTELRSKFKDNAAGVFTDFINGLAKLNKEGGSVNQVLGKLNLTGVASKLVLGTLATTGFETLNKALVTVKESTGALTTEFDTASTKLVNQSAKFGIAWDNLVLSIENGQGIIGKASAGVVGFFTDMVSSITPSTRSMTINEEAVNALAAQYDSLTREGQLLGGSFKLSRDKQEELRFVTAKLGELMPSIITKFDQYGNALDINRAKIDKMTKAQRELIAVQNKGDIQNANQVFDIFSKSKNKLQGKILEGTGFFTDDADIANMRDRLVLMSGQMYNEVKRIKSLGGELTKQQQDLLDYYEREAKVVIKSGKDNATITNQKVANSIRTADVVKAEIAALEEANVTLALNSKERLANVSAIKKLQKELNDANGKESRGGSNSLDVDIKARNTLQDKIQDAIKKSTIKQLEANDQELANIKKHYDDLRKEAVKYNSDKENIKKGLKVSISGLSQAETRETGEALYKQETAKQAIEFEKQKQLFADYEAYKTTFGAAAAKKRYGNEVKTNEDLIKELTKEVAEFQAKQALSQMKGGQGGILGISMSALTVAGKELTEEEKKRFELKTKQLEDLEKKQVDSYQALLASLMDYEQTRAVMISTYNENRAKLVANGEKQAIVVLDRLHKEALGSLDDQNAQKLKAYKDLYSDIDKLSDGAIRKIIADGQKMLAGLLLAGKISKEEAEKLAKQISTTIDALDKRVPERLIALGSELKNIGSIVGEVNEGFGQWLNTFGDVIGGIGDIRSRIDAVNKLPKGDILGGITGGIGVFSSALSIVSSIGGFINGLLDKTKENQEQEAYAAELRNRQAENLNKVLERQIALINEAYGVEKIGKYSEAVKAATDNQAKYISELSGKLLLTGDKVVDGIIAKFNNGEQLFGTDKLGYEALQKAGFFKKLGDLSKASLEDLRKLLDSNQIDEATARIINNLINAKQAIIDLGNAAKEQLTGTSFEAFADGIVDALSRGEDAAKNFEDAIRKAMLNSLKTEEFKAEVQKWYDMFAEAAKDGLTAAEIDALGPAYQDIIAKQKQRQADLEKATGIKINVDDSELNELRTSILRIALESQDLLKDLGNDFTASLKEDFLSTMESGDYADKVKAYRERFTELTKKGLTAADVASLKAEYDALALLAQEKIKEYEQRTGEKISVPVVIDPQVATFGEKLFNLLTTAADKTGAAVEEILSGYILDALKAEVITNALKPLADKVKNLYKDGKIPTKDEIVAATAEMNAFIENARAQLKTIEEATGLTFGENIKENITDAAKAVDSELQSISDSIRDVFANTDGAYENFLTKFDDMVKNKILNTFQTSFLQTKLVGFLEQFNALDKVEDGKKAEQLALLKAQYAKIIADGKLEYERLQDVFGVDYKPVAAQSQGAISSAIGRTITEETANVIAGPIVGTYEEAKRISGWMGKCYAIATQNLEVAIKIEANTRRGADNTDGIGAKLDEIARNTRKSPSSTLNDNYLRI